MPPETHPQNTPGSPTITLVLVAAFSCLVLLVLLHHEMWEDEWQAWLLARDSASLPALFHNLRYEGHPGLWHLLLYLLSRVTAQALAMQLLHLAVAAVTVYLFLKYSPLTNLQKILFIFGYFPFYEYAVISRNYGLGLLLLFACCALIRSSQKRNYPALSLLLFLLAQTSVYGLMLALALGTSLIFEFLRDNEPRQPRPQSKASLAASILIFIAGILLSVYQLIPPPDSGFAVDWRWGFDSSHAIWSLSTVWKSYVPLPAWEYHFWNTNIISSPGIQGFLASGPMLVSALLFLRTPAVLFLYLFGTLELLAFTYTKYPGSLRHHGHLFMLFLACCWLAADRPRRGLRWRILENLADFAEAQKNRFLVGLLSVQLAAGLVASGRDLLCPFSESKAAATYIQKNSLADALMVGYEDDAASAVSGYLNRQIYYPCRGRTGTFVIWDNRRKPLEAPEILAKTKELANRTSAPVLLIMNREMAGWGTEAPLLKAFTKSIIPRENYYLYLLPGRPEAHN